MDFGQVCLRSVSSKDLMIVNNLHTYIHVVVQVRVTFAQQFLAISLQESSNINL